MNITDEDLNIIHTKIGMRYLFAEDKLDVARVLKQTKYELLLQDLQAELVNLQQWIIDNNKKLVVIFEGRDAAGKGGAIRRFTAHINPRHYRVVALPKPTSEEEGQWYFQRYVNKLPNPGEIVFLDRSWYNRAVVEPVNGFCSNEQYEIFMGQVNEFEKMIIESDTYLVKFYFSISKSEQARRFEEIQKNPLKQWKMSPVDRKAQELWNQYTKYKKEMFARTNSKHAPWVIIKANRKTSARVESIRHLLRVIPYNQKIEEKEKS